MAWKTTTAGSAVVPRRKVFVDTGGRYGVTSDTDCTSFVLAQRELVDEVFAFDAHFRQFGMIVQPVP